ncbi:hypothetical protein AYO47_05490 [Planctomyces sp. SCGC AG-212-M04]|nr:hypothetical protein AYO47_05490 [Planctomyces sp. SCGC AG-212-M04]
MRNASVLGGLQTLLIAGLWAMSGCGSQPSSPTVDAPVYNSLEEVKQRLGEVAQNGDGGSSLMGLSESIQKLKETEPKKAQILEKGLGQIESAPSAAQRKAIAAKLMKDL